MGLTTYQRDGPFSVKTTSANCWHTVDRQMNAFVKIAPISGDQDPVELEIFNALVFNQYIDPSFSRVPRMISLAKACIDKRGKKAIVSRRCDRPFESGYVAIVCENIGHHALNSEIPKNPSGPTKMAVGGRIRRFLEWSMTVSRDHGFSHNDMHTGNVIYDKTDKKLKLIDFGRSVFRGFEVLERQTRDANKKPSTVLESILGRVPRYGTLRSHIHRNYKGITSSPTENPSWLFDVVLLTSFLLHNCPETILEVGLHSTQNGFRISSSVGKNATILHRMAVSQRSELRKHDDLYQLLSIGALAISMFLARGGDARAHPAEMLNKLHKVDRDVLVEHVNFVFSAERGVKRPRAHGGAFDEVSSAVSTYHDSDAYEEEEDAELDANGEDVDALMSFLFPTSIEEAYSPYYRAQTAYPITLEERWRPAHVDAGRLLQPYQHVFPDKSSGGRENAHLGSFATTFVAFAATLVFSYLSLSTSY